jgi:thioredoxin reductase
VDKQQNISLYDLIIVGGGPVGLAAAVYAARKQLNTLLVSMDIGGQINTTLGKAQRARRR